MGTVLGTSRIVGRGAQLRALRDAFEAGARGETRVVLLCGEAGIGKSRLLREFGDSLSHVASAQPVVYALGHCVDVGTTGSLYAPIRRLLRRLRIEVGGEAFRRAAATPDTEGTLAALLPDLRGPDEEIGAPTVDQVAEAVGSVIESLSIDHHLVLAVEDLHWADVATADLLRILAATLQATHVTVVMTLRSGELDPGHPIARVLAEMERGRTVTVVELERLDAGASRELIDAVHAGPVHARAELVERGQGVPFYLEELAAVHDTALPDGLRAIVLARYERLGPAARTAVDTLAAGGDRVGHALLSSAFADELDGLQDGLREAVTGGVIRIEGDDYVFRHALIREAVLTGVLPATRAGFHARFAAGLQREVDAGRHDLAAACAQQWHAAHDPARAFDATLIARAHAVSRTVFVDAARQGERLLGLWPVVPDAERRAGESIGMVATGVAWSWWSAGDPERAVSAVAAGEEVCAPEDVVERGLLQHIAALAVAEGGALDASVRHARTAVSLLEGVADDARAAAPLVLSLGLIAAASVAAATEDDVADTMRRAASVADRTGDIEARARLLLSTGFLDYMRGRFAAALENARAAATLDVRLETHLIAANSEVEALLRLRRYAEVIEAGRLRIESLTTAGLAHETTGTILVVMAWAHAARGEADEGARLLERVRRRAVADAILAESAAVLRILLDVWHGAVADAPREVRERAAVGGPTDHLGRLVDRAVAHGEAALNAAMDPSRATSSLDAAIDALSLVGHPTLRRMPGIAASLLAPAARAAAEARLRGSERWRELDANVRALADAQDPRGPDAPLLALVAAEAARGARSPDASHLWRTATTAGPGEGLHVRHRMYARFRLAQALEVEGRREDAVAVLRALVIEAPVVGVAVVGSWAAGELLRVRGATMVERTSDAPMASLTPRERAVLELLAHGLTNREIGDRLVISPKTVSVHVSSIIAKLGAANRTAAAAMYSAMQ